MSSFIKFLLVGVAALAAVTADAQVTARSGEPVLTSLRQVAAPTLVAYHRRHHRHRHHAHRPVHRPARR